jgi:hypothetical protein
MQVNLDILNCGICYCTIEDAVSCDSCGNSFCSQCVNDYIKISRKNNQTLKCPMCNKRYFRPKKNNSVNELIQKVIHGRRTYKCKKCNRIFLEERKYDEHKLKCNNIKCCTCGEIFKDENLFLEHFNDKNNFQEKLYVCTFLLNANLKQIPSNFFNKINTEEIIENENSNVNSIIECETDSGENELKINKYMNYFEKDIKIPNDEILEENKVQNLLNKEYDLIFCKSNNKINNKICKPGNEQCINCMKINQLYHGLKKHYLINCAGRVCTYGKGTFHCNCLFEKDMKHESGRLYSYNFICKDKNNVCLACLSMNKLIDKYLNSKTIEALYKRDKLSGY